MGTCNGLSVLLEPENLGIPGDMKVSFFFFLFGVFITPLQLMHAHLFCRIEREGIGRTLFFILTC